MSQGLEAEGLVKSYGGRRVVDRVSITVKQGETVGLLGPNGAGKSTTFNCVVGLLKADEGAVRLDGQTITKLPLHKRARHGLGYLPQDSSVFRQLTVRDNLLAVLELRKDLNRPGREERATELLAEFELESVAGQLAETLSGGERRRTEIARCLAMQPRIVLLDEPFAGIDPLAVAELQKLIRTLQSKNLGVLITDHNVRETLGICDRAYILVEGTVVAQGTASEIANDDLARRLYLGESFSL